MRLHAGNAEKKIKKSLECIYICMYICIYKINKNTHTMTKYFKNTHMHHQLSDRNSKTTKCGMRVDEFTSLVNKDGWAIPSPSRAYKFEPYKTNGRVCQKCNS